MSYRYKKLTGGKFVSFIGTEKECSEPLITRVKSMKPHVNILIIIKVKFYTVYVH